MPENLFKYEKTCCQHGPTTKFGGQWPARAGKPQARDPPPRRKQKILFDQELKLVASPTKKATKNPVCSDCKEEVFLNII